jgi:hypothetical protein
LRRTFVPRIRYLGFTTRGKKGPLTTTGDLYACESRTIFDTNINRQQKVTGPGSYRLQTLEGEDISNSWNVDQLCRFYA